jgi:hypothetical protein
VDFQDVRLGSYLRAALRIGGSRSIPGGIDNAHADDVHPNLSLFRIERRTAREVAVESDV